MHTLIRFIFSDGYSKKHNRYFNGQRERTLFSKRNKANSQLNYLKENYRTIIATVHIFFTHLIPLLSQLKRILLFFM